MRLLDGTSAGTWLLARAGDWARVDGAAGTGFEAYARVLHPVRAERGDHEEARWTWAEVARRNRRTMHPLVQWRRLTEDETLLEFEDGWRIDQLEEGRLPLDVLAAIGEHLAAATRTPQELIAAIWVGHGELHGSARPYVQASTGWPPRVPGQRAWAHIRAAAMTREERETGAERKRLRRRLRRGPWFAWPGREMLLFATSSAELMGHAAHLEGITPQMLWPQGREWVLASEIDWDSTIVAGPRALVDAVLADPRLEAVEVPPDADLTWEGDTVNPPR
ncbi:hypothetical protein [Brachybacterium hainanense]|uniref:Uncharacterized protein n=1 Tax=Brachybacterium hainanense TaxID=1541174 RepID=A0ABV6R9P3_9MICO